MKTDTERIAEWLGVKELPENMLEFMKSRYINLQLNICKTDVEKGYGTRITKTLSLFLPYERCNNCQYHSLYNWDDSETGCRARGGRHTLKKGWDQVFMWNPDDGVDLETSFQNFLEEPWVQPLLKR